MSARVGRSKKSHEPRTIACPGRISLPKCTIHTASLCDGHEFVFGNQML